MSNVCHGLTSPRHLFYLVCAAVDPAEGEHGGGEPTVGRAEPGSTEGEPGLVGAEPGAPRPALLRAERVPVSSHAQNSSVVFLRSTITVMFSLQQHTGTYVVANIFQFVGNNTVGNNTV